MKLSPIVFVLFSPIIFGALAHADDEPKYSAGEGWEIQSGPYQGQRVIISHKETHDVMGDIYHISIYGPIEHESGKVISAMPHFPFAFEGLEKSDMKFTTNYYRVPDGWQEGYGIWKEAFDKGEAGVFTVTVTEAVDIVFKMLPEDSPRQAGGQK